MLDSGAKELCLLSGIPILGRGENLALVIDRDDDSSTLENVLEMVFSLVALIALSEQEMSLVDEHHVDLVVR